MQIGGQGPNGQVSCYLGGQADRQECRKAGMQFNGQVARQLAVRTGRQADMQTGGLEAKRKGNYSVSKEDMRQTDSQQSGQLARQSSRRTV